MFVKAAAWCSRQEEGLGKAEISMKKKPPTTTIFHYTVESESLGAGFYKTSHK